MFKSCSAACIDIQTMYMCLAGINDQMTYDIQQYYPQHETPDDTKRIY